jgi:hypothetical protein
VTLDKPNRALKRPAVDMKDLGIKVLDLCKSQRHRHVKSIIKPSYLDSLVASKDLTLTKSLLSKEEGVQMTSRQRAKLYSHQQERIGLKWRKTNN